MSHDTIRRLPVDLILHATAEALHTLILAAIKDSRPDDAAKSAELHHALSRCIAPGSVAEEWNASGPIAQIGEWVASITTGDVQQTANRRAHPVAYDRAIEIAVARRLADTACALRITGDAEDNEQALALWRAAEAITGIITEHDKADVDIAEALGARDGESNLEAAKRVRDERDAAIAAQKLAESIRDGHMREVSVCCEREIWVRKMWGETQAERDAANEARAQMQAKLASAERERDAARTNEEWVRVATQVRAEVERRLEYANAIVTICTFLGVPNSCDEAIEAVRRLATPPAKPRPQPGDAVPWAEVEDGCLYFDAGDGGGTPFLARTDGRWFWLFDDTDRDLERLLTKGWGCKGCVRDAVRCEGTLVARDLGSDPKAWRKAMRDWMGNGNRPASVTLARA